MSNQLNNELALKDQLLQHLGQQKVHKQALELGELRIAQDISNKYIKDVASSILPLWKPPEPSLLQQTLTLVTYVEMFQSQFVKQSELGSQLTNALEKKTINNVEVMSIPIAYSTLLSVQQQQLDKNLIAAIRMVFEQCQYNIQMLRIQELLYKNFKLTEVKYDIIPAYLLDNDLKDIHFPCPPFDPRVRLVSLITIASSKIPKKSEILLFLLSNRVSDFIESIFWLTHSMVFSPRDGVVQFEDLFPMFRNQKKTIFDAPDKGALKQKYIQSSIANLLQNQITEPTSLINDSNIKLMEQFLDDQAQQYPMPFSVESKQYRGNYFLPEHLDVVKKNLNALDYLANRLADCYAAIQRAWAGCSSDTKVVIQEILPYFSSNVVIRMFKRCFPQYVHVFSQRFQMNIYYNVLLATTGILPYQDMIDNLILKYFGDETEAQVSILAQYIPSASPLMGSDISDIDLSTVATGIYTNRINNHQNIKFQDRQHLVNFLQESNMMSLSSGDASEIKPIEFDFVLFKQLISSDSRYDVSYAAARNVDKQKNKMVDLAQSVIQNEILLTQSLAKVEQTVSLIVPMEKEAFKVAQHQIPRTQMQDFETIKKDIKVDNSEQIKEQQEKKIIRALGLFELDEIIAPEANYTKNDYSMLTFLEQKDIDDLKDFNAKLHLTNTDQSTTGTGNDSVTLGNTFIVRVDPQYRKFKQQDVKFSQIIQSEIVTSNDIVFDMYDPEYQEMIETAMKEGQSTAQIIQGERKSHKHGILPTIQKRQIDSTMDKIIQIEQVGAAIQYIHPLKISSQQFHTSRVTPLILRYLEMSDAPVPSQFINSIAEFQPPDPKKFQTSFSKRKDNFRNGISNFGLSSSSNGTRSVNLVQRTRNDDWFSKSVKQSAVSKNNFHEQYLERVQESKLESQQEQTFHREEMMKLQVRKIMFSTPQLRGYKQRAQALAKTISSPAPKCITEETVKQKVISEMQDILGQRINLINSVERMGRDNIKREKRNAETNGDFGATSQLETQKWSLLEELKENENQIQLQRQEIEEQQCNKTIPQRQQNVRRASKIVFQNSNQIPSDKQSNLKKSQ